MALKNQGRKPWRAKAPIIPVVSGEYPPPILNPRRGINQLNHLKLDTTFITTKSCHLEAIQTVHVLDSDHIFSLRESMKQGWRRNRGQQHRGEHHNDRIRNSVVKTEQPSVFAPMRFKVTQGMGKLPQSMTFLIGQGESVNASSCTNPKAFGLVYFHDDGK